MQTRLDGRRKYDALVHALQALPPDQQRATFTFAEIEALIGVPLPVSAWNPGFWSGSSTKPQPWQRAGFKARLVSDRQAVEFRRVQS